MSNSKLLSAVSAIILGGASAAFAGGRNLPPGPEFYVDDQHVYRSIRSDWRGIASQRPARVNSKSRED